MTNPRAFWAMAICLGLATALSGCGDSTSGGGGALTPDTPATGDAEDDAGGSTSDIAPLDTGGGGADTAALAVPMIGDSLPCGKLGPAGGLAGAKSDVYLERHDFDPAVFPDALCNDGTPAFFYFRPYSGEENRDKWVVQLQGGGSCGSPVKCAQRWCSIDTNFGMQGMTANESPAHGIDGKGILARRADNPLAGYNQVFVRYCTSDSWDGAARDVVANLEHPTTGEPIAYRIHFLGARVVEAVISTLRQDGVAPLQHETSGQALPDLDEAEVFILAGASGGGGGTTLNADRVAEAVRAGNIHCGGDTCPLEVRAVIDSILSPELETLDYSTAVLCTEEPHICDYETHFSYAFSEGSYAFRNQQSDASCLAWHATHAPGTEYQCADTQHILRHHVTTPMFVRMSQRDSLISGNAAEASWTVPGKGVMDADLFAELIRLDLAAMADIQTSAHEGALIQTAPGVFGPTCPRHETLSSNEATYDVTIEVDSVPRTMFDIFEAWRAGGSPSAAIATPETPDVCPNAP